MNKPEASFVVSVLLRSVSLVLISSLMTSCGQQRYGMDDGFIRQDAERLFPIGCYELPKDDSDLAAMAKAGINLVRCHSRKDLDRAQAAGMLGWMPLPLHGGVSDELQERIETVKDHPALAIWEGPDEIVESFTDSSRLWKTLGVYDSASDWWNQTPNAVNYAEGRAREIMPNLQEGIQLVRSLDDRNLQVWFNESNRADVRFVRQYVDLIDVTGCDIYPIKTRGGQPIPVVGAAVDRWKQVGRGRGVWMVLQAFSWHVLGDYFGHKEALYPKFAESRFMAYDAIVHGAEGILYWGSHYLKSEEFRQSLYALTSELAVLQPFLVAPPATTPELRLIETKLEPVNRGVQVMVRRVGRDWLIILVNEDDRRHMGVEVSGLQCLNGRTMHLLYGQESIDIQKGELVTRMQPYEVKVFTTSRKWESQRREGREFGR